MNNTETPTNPLASLNRMQRTAYDDIVEYAQDLYRLTRTIEAATTRALADMANGALPSGGGIGGSGYLGHQIPNDLTIATVRLKAAISAAHRVGLEPALIDGAYRIGVKAPRTSL